MLIFLHYFTLNIDAEQLSYKFCPHKNILNPCRCQEYNKWDSQTILYCGGTEKYDFEFLFRKLSKSLNQDEKHFDWLYLNNTEITNLTANFFGDIKFSNLIFDNTFNLSFIHNKTFSKMNDKVKYIYGYNTKLAKYRKIDSPFSQLKNLVQLDIVSESSCPPSDMIEPCICFEEDSLMHPFGTKRHHINIECKSNISYNLIDIFKKISETNSSLYIDELVLRNIEDLPENAFGNVDFGQIRIEDSPLLQSMNENAFVENSLIQSIRISNVNFSSQNIYETFRAINKLKQLRFLYIWSTELRFIPPNAFSEVQRHLKGIYLYGNQIKTIGSFAFYNLPNLETISLDGNQISLISKYSFSSMHSSNKRLLVSLVSNPLNASSFEFLAFNGAQRPIKLSFADPGGCYWNVTYLEEEVFGPFLDKDENQIYLEPECALICDCKMKWLAEAPQHMKNRVTLVPLSKHINKYPGAYVPCANGNSLFNINTTDLEYCYQ